MIIDHNHPEYKKRRTKQGMGKFNGAYYYSRDIVKYIIPKVKTDRNWVTVRLEDVPVPNHSIVFIHNNRNPNYYEYLKKANDLILVCGVPETCEYVKFFGKAVYLPLSVDIKSIEKYKKEPTKEMAFAGRRLKINNRVPSKCDILTDMPQNKLIEKMADYKKVYAVGRTAIQAKILGCEIGVYDTKYPDPSLWHPLDCSKAALILQHLIDEIDVKSGLAKFEKVNVVINHDTSELFIDDYATDEQLANFKIIKE